MEYLEIEDSIFFNYTIIYSMLSRKGIKMTINDLWDTKLDFIKLICVMSKDTSYKYDEKNKSLTFTPGPLLGGEYNYNCKDEIVNYIVPLLVLLPFNSSQIRIKFTGITNKLHSVELINIAHFTLLKKFDIPGLNLVVNRTGFHPVGQGEVDLFCGSVNLIKNLDLPDHSELLRTRALLISSRVNSSYVKEMSDTIVEHLDDLNLRVFTNVHNGKDSGPSPGYQCILFMESKEGVFYTEKDGSNKQPKDVAKEACLDLLASATRGGVFDEKLYPLLFSFLAISSTDVSTILIYQISEELKIILGLLKIFFNYDYNVINNSNGLIVKSTGCGLKNINRKID